MTFHPHDPPSHSPRSAARAPQPRPRQHAAHSPARAIAAAGARYFAIVFGAGFVLGAVRVTLLVPRLGERAAELLEMPIMALVIWRSSRFVARRRTHELPPRASLGTGGVALALLVGAELLLAATTRPDGIAGYLANRDPVSGTVYVAMLMWFAVLPWWMARRAACDPDGFAAPLDRRADRH